MRNDHEREAFCRCPESVSELVRRGEADGVRFPTLPARQTGTPFAESLRTRMLFSCLVDADFLDTEEHFTPGTGRQRQTPELQSGQAQHILLGYLAGLSAEGDLNRRRRKLLSDCLSAAAATPGLFTLTAPTGSGKNPELPGVCPAPYRESQCPTSEGRPAPFPPDRRRNSVYQHYRANRAGVS